MNCGHQLVPLYFMYESFTAAEQDIRCLLGLTIAARGSLCILTLSPVPSQTKKKFLAWADSEEGIEVSPDVDLFHAFAEVGMVELLKSTNQHDFHGP